MNPLVKFSLPIALVAFLAIFYLLNSEPENPDVGKAKIRSAPIPESLLTHGKKLKSLEALDAPQSSSLSANGYLARIMLDDPEEVSAALKRAEELYERGEVKEGDNPLAFVIHGPEVQIFLKDNYQRYKPIVDLAAKLSAYNVVDVKVCRTRLGSLGETEGSLPAFVETVPFGPDEVERLVVDEQYLYF